jgi:hypothetical protein
MTAFLIQVKADVNRVDESTATDDQKAQAHVWAEELASLLLDPSATWPDTVQEQAPLIADLSKLVSTILEEPLGACEYDGGCIVTNQAQCDGLNGKWLEGAPCIDVIDK